jgi:hypothetical protein
MKSVTAIICVAALSLWTGSASAAQIDPRCKGMKDKLGCTCAVQNGGDIRIGRDGKPSWFSVRGSNNRATNDAFVQCNIRHKGQRG